MVAVALRNGPEAGESNGVTEVSENARLGVVLIDASLSLDVIDGAVDEDVFMWALSIVVESWSLPGSLHFAVKKNVL